MLYLISGNDHKKGGLCRDTILASFSNISYQEIDGEGFNKEVYQELLFRQSLFGQKAIILFRGVLEDKENEAFLLKNLKEMAESPTAFIIWEEKLTKAVQTRVEKHSTNSCVYNVPLAPTKQIFSVFSLTDAVGRRDKKQAWILLQKAFSEGISPENVYGALFWQLKALILVQSGKNVDNSSSLGLKPFVAQKARGFSKNYTKKEVRNILSELLSVYHRARRGQEEMIIGLEKLILAL